MNNLTSEWNSGNLLFAPTAEAVAGDITPAARFGITGRPLQVKVHNKPAAGKTMTGSSIEVRAEPISVIAEHFAVDSTLDWKPATNSTATGGGCRAVQGVCRLATGYTSTGGDLCGVYGQVALSGTAVANGAGIFMSALYGLIEDGGTYTAVGHLCSAWLDSHLTKTVTAGSTEFLYISNNGSTTFDQAIYVYAGNKITNLFNINTASGMVSANTEAATTLTFTNWRTIKVVLEGATHYIPAAQTVAATG